MLTKTGFAAACVFTVAATAAQAQGNCAALKQIAHINMEQTKDGRWLVPVKLNGTDKKMLLDTSVVPSAIFSDYATETNLALTDALPTTPPPGAAAAGGGRGGRGAAPAGAPFKPAAPPKVAKVDSFGLGTIVANGGYFKVADDTRKDRALDSNIIGVLGTDMLSKQDFDLDFGAKTLGLFSSDHCPGKVIYWSGPTVAISFYVDAKDHIRFPVLVDGEEISAAINTAVSQNEMSLVYGKYKLRFDVTDAGYEKVADKDPPQYSHRFKTLDIGGLAINNPLVMVVDDSKVNKIVVNPSAGMHSLTKDNNTPDLTLGTAFLNKFHIYVASKELTMYVTPAVSTPAPAAAATP